MPSCPLLENAARTKRPASAAQRASARPSRPSERLLEVVDDVVGILTAYGEAEEARRDAGFRQLLGRVLAVARRGGVVDDRVDASQACGAPAELEGVH